MRNYAFLRGSARSAGAAFASIASLGLMVFADSPARAQVIVKLPEAHMSIQPPMGSNIVTRQIPGQTAKHGKGWVLDVGGPPAKTGYRINFNVMVAPAVPGVVYDARTWPAMSAEMKRASPSVKGVTTGLTRVGGDTASFVTGVITMPKYVVHAKVVQVAHAGMRYTISFTADESVYARQVGAFDKSVASIKWN